MKYILFIFIALTSVSCQKFLQEDLQGTYSSQTFYQTQSQALMALTATYNSLLYNNTDNNLWVFGDVASDDATKGSLPGDQIDILSINQHNVLSTNSELLNIWTYYYEGISRANLVLYYVPSINMNAALKARYLGEAKFIRAYLYFNLVNIFGNIPLKVIPTLGEAEINTPLSPVSAIYAQIETDLLQAVPVLPTTYDAADIGRATKGAALGMLAKVYLYETNYASAIQTIASIDSLGIYQLMPVYCQNFQAPTQGNMESLFEIHHLRGQTPMLGNYLNQYFGPRGNDTAIVSGVTSIYNYGYAFDVPTQNFINEFEVTSGGTVDPRLDYSVGRPGQKWINGEDYHASWSPTTFLNRKHTQPFSEVSYAFNDGSLSYVCMRYADILLMKAESLNELGQSSQALIPLNKVRQRARQSYLNDVNLTGYGVIPANLLPDVTTTNQDTLRTAIQHERRVELGLEFHRYFDLMRYGQQVAEAALASTSFSYASDRYFPIPLLEKENNSAINQ